MLGARAAVHRPAPIVSFVMSAHTGIYLIDDVTVEPARRRPPPAAPPPLPVRTSLANLDFALPCVARRLRTSARATRRAATPSTTTPPRAARHTVWRRARLPSERLRSARTSTAAASPARRNCIASTRRGPPRTASAAARAALRPSTGAARATDLRRAAHRRRERRKARADDARELRRPTATRASGGCARVVVAEAARPAHRGKLDLQPPMGDPATSG